MSTGLVILNYNDANTVLKLINIVEKFSSFDRIVVVDNKSTDSSWNILHDKLNLNRIDLISTKKNSGYASGNNFGAKYLIDNYSTDILFFANPDIVFDEKLVKKIISVFNNKDFAVLSGIMHNPDGSVDRAPYRNIYSYWHDIFDCFFIGRFFQKRKKYIVDANSDFMNVEVIQGSFWAIRQDVLKNIGFLDENTFLYYEEMILAKRLIHAKEKTGIVNEPYYHFHSVSIKKSLSLVNAWKRHLQSKLYYEKTYNNIGMVKSGLLILCCKLSIMEKCIISAIRDFIRR